MSNNFSVTTRYCAMIVQMDTPCCGKFNNHSILITSSMHSNFRFLETFFGKDAESVKKTDHLPDLQLSLFYNKIYANNESKESIPMYQRCNTIFF